MDVLRFEEGYFERIWGGQKLQTVYGKPIPSDVPMGEAWLIADHPVYESVVAEGEHKGATLRQLLADDAQAILGTRAQLTIHGRFPLLLKILDARDVLSVQVHPDDVCAKELGEPDVGKTEMWHVLQADPGSELICGLDASVTSERFLRAIREGAPEALMTRFNVRPGSSVHVPAGTVHAIGAGVFLAEIQQNSDLTYRIYDWGRVEANGKPRALHFDKAAKAIKFGQPETSLIRPFEYTLDTARCGVLAACPYFAAELLSIEGSLRRHTRCESFHIVLAKTDDVLVQGKTVRAGCAVLVPGSTEAFELSGRGTVLDYYVPDVESDIVTPLVNAGHPIAEVWSAFVAP